MPFVKIGQTIQNDGETYIISSLLTVTLIGCLLHLVLNEDQYLGKPLHVKSLMGMMVLMSCWSEMFLTHLNHQRSIMCGPDFYIEDVKEEISCIQVSHLVHPSLSLPWITACNRASFPRNLSASCLQVENCKIRSVLPIIDCHVKSRLLLAHLAGIQHPKTVGAARSGPSRCTILAHSMCHLAAYYRLPLPSSWLSGDCSQGGDEAWSSLLTASRQEKMRWR